MGGNALGQLVNIVGLVIGAAIVATLAAKPQIVNDFFTGVAKVTTAAEGPVLK